MDGYLFLLILSEPLVAKMSLRVYTTHLAHFSTHTSLSSDWWAQRRETVGSVVSGGWAPTSAPAARALFLRRRRPRGLPGRAVEQLQLYGEEEGSRD